MVSGFGHLAWDSTEGEERIQEEDGATVERILTTPERNRS